MKFNKKREWKQWCTCGRRFTIPMKTEAAHSPDCAVVDVWPNELQRAANYTHTAPRDWCGAMRLADMMQKHNNFKPKLQLALRLRRCREVIYFLLKERAVEYGERAAFLFHEYRLWEPEASKDTFRLYTAYFEQTVQSHLASMSMMFDCPDAWPVSYAEQTLPWELACELGGKPFKFQHLKGGPWEVLKTKSSYFNDKLFSEARFVIGRTWSMPNCGKGEPFSEFDYDYDYDYDRAISDILTKPSRTPIKVAPAKLAPIKVETPNEPAKPAPTKITVTAGSEQIATSSLSAAIGAIDAINNAASSPEAAKSSKEPEIIVESPPTDPKTMAAIEKTVNESLFSPIVKARKTLDGRVSMIFPLGTDIELIKEAINNQMPKEPNIVPVTTGNRG